MLGFSRPHLFTSYEGESKIFNTSMQRLFAGLAIVVLLLIPFDVPVISHVPPFRHLGDPDWLRPVSTVLIFAVAALGLHLLSGVAGQVSLGHAFFMGVGAYGGAFLGGEGTASVYGLGLPIWVWLPGAGITAALVGILIAPVAVRLRGLYLAIVTLGLVFVGIHMGNTNWGRKFAGDPGLGRDFPTLDIRLWKEENPLITVSEEGRWLWFEASKGQKNYIVLLLIMLIVMVLVQNITRTRTGRALQAIRDRDVAAEVMGIPEFKYKVIAFALSSFFAGMGGALLGSLTGKLPAVQWSLFLSVEFIAILLIGGIGTMTGTMLGTVFVILSPVYIERFTEWLEEAGEAEEGLASGGNIALVLVLLVAGIVMLLYAIKSSSRSALGQGDPPKWVGTTAIAGTFATLFGLVGLFTADGVLRSVFRPISAFLLSDGPDDFGPVSIATQATGWPMNAFDWNIALYGVLIILFLIFEPLGLYGIWRNVKSYFQRWPFSY